MTIDEIRQYAKENISHCRFIHTLGVVETARELAIAYGEDGKKAEIAALLHDIAKEFSEKEKMDFCLEHKIPLDDYLVRNIHLTHGDIAAFIAQEKCLIHDENILNAIANHTLGRNNMSTLEKIIYLSDIIEPNRRDHIVLEQLRKMVYVSLDDAMRVALYYNLAYLNSKNKEVHPVIYSVLEEYKNITHMEGIDEGYRTI